MLVEVLNEKLNTTETTELSQAILTLISKGLSLQEAQSLDKAIRASQQYSWKHYRIALPQ